MHITLYTDYSLRVMIYLALNSGERATIRDMAGAYDISRNHLTKVVHQLQLGGYLETVRGPSGGVVLARAPEDINIGTVVRTMEPDLNLVSCFKDEQQCVITPHCRLRGMMSEALQAFLATLDQYTLADIAEHNTTGLVRVLGLDQATPS
jgi:Rrf2 family nitric oxide-sensitive transcriptional repressor